MKNINELIEVNLKLLSEVDRNSMFFDDFIDCDGNELHTTFRTDFFASEMEKRGLISITNFICFITEFGLNIVENGGWNKYLLTQQQTEKEAEKQRITKKRIELENLETNTRVNKFFLKTKWWTFGIAIFTFLFSIYSYFDNVKTIKDLEVKLEKLEKKVQLIKLEPKK